MNIKKILSIILVMVWMIAVFYFSHQQGESSGNTSRTITIKIVEIIDIQNRITKEVAEEIIQIVEPLIRKLAHLSIYILGGILIVNCVHQFAKIDRTSIIYSTIIGVVYAISDEIHQLFIFGRSGRIVDVIIDSWGVFIGIGIYLLITKIVDKIRTNSID